MPPNPVVLAGCLPPLFMEREPFAVRGGVVFPTPNADTSPARETFHQTAPSRTDIVLLNKGRVVVTRSDRAGENQRLLFTSAQGIWSRTSKRMAGMLFTES